jgi:Mrp family chromosome partitioning ATPase
MVASKSDQPLAETSSSLALYSAAGKLMGDFSGETVANIRRMLTNLMYQATMPQSIANVAALRGEGVTYITLAMAATLASDVSANVCAVELNWWQPSMQLYLAGTPPTLSSTTKRRRAKAAAAGEQNNLPASDVGIGALLRGDVALDQALNPTSLPNLFVLPAGHVPAEARSALARSAQLKELFVSLKQRFDYLIIDIPAVAATSDTVALTSLADSVAIVVRQGVTPANTVKTALDEVKHVPVLGVILNQVQVFTPKWILNLLPQE